VLFSSKAAVHTTTQNIMIKFYTTITMPVVVTTKVLKTKLSRKYHDHREVKKIKKFHGLYMALRTEW
jgi:hypothetical protein